MAIYGQVRKACIVERMSRLSAESLYHRTKIRGKVHILTVVSGSWKLIKENPISGVVRFPCFPLTMQKFCFSIG